MRRSLRKSLWSDRNLDDQSRDLRSIFSVIPDVEIRTVDGLYQTGMTLRLEQGDSPPVAIELVRCVLKSNPETPVAHGTACSFRLTQQGAQITRIDGLTPDTGTQYTFTFRITYEAT